MGNRRFGAREKTILALVLIIGLLGFLFGDVLGLFGSETFTVEAIVVARVTGERPRANPGSDNTQFINRRIEPYWYVDFAGDDGESYRTYGQNVYEALTEGDRVILTYERARTGGGVTNIEIIE